MVRWLQTKVVSEKATAHKYASGLYGIGVESVDDLKHVSAEDAKRIFLPVHLRKFARGVAEIVDGAAMAGAGHREIGSTKRRKRRVNKRFTVGHELFLLNTGVPLILSCVFVCVCVCVGVSDFVSVDEITLVLVLA